MPDPGASRPGPKTRIMSAMGSLTLDWLHIVFLLGAVQGVFLTVALATKRRNRTANRLLAVLMFSFSIFLASAVYHAMGWEQRYPHFFGAAYPMPFLFGPLVYLYAVAAADRTRSLTWRDALHFLPFVIVVVAALPVYMMSGAEKVAFYQDLRRGQVPLLVAIADPLKLLSGMVYSVWTFFFLRRHGERVKDSYSSVERVNLHWLMALGAGAAAIWAMVVILALLESAGVPSGQRADDLVSLAIAIMVYAIGYKGLRQPEVFRFETAEYPVPRSPMPESQPANLPVAPPQLVLSHSADAELPARPETEQGAPRYERSGLSERQAERLRVALLNVMDNERPWQDSELTLADLASRLNTTPHKLSEVLNSQLGQTFYDFVNGYRVREVQRRIAAGEAQRVKMLTLALDAGFASKSTFNVVFKKFTSQTPSDYRQAAGA